jgi:hypothetical protein
MLVSEGFNTLLGRGMTVIGKEYQRYFALCEGEIEDLGQHTHVGTIFGWLDTPEDTFLAVALNWKSPPAVLLSKECLLAARCDLTVAREPVRLRKTLSGATEPRVALSVAAPAPTTVAPPGRRVLSAAVLEASSAKSGALGAAGEGDSREVDPALREDGEEIDLDSAVEDREAFVFAPSIYEPQFPAPADQPSDDGDFE